MTRTGQAAIDYARSRVGGEMPAAGYCLQFVRQCFDIASYYGSAIDAWNGCRAPHPGDRNPPPAVPVWFRTPSVYDHVAFFVGPNEVISTFNEDIRSFNGLADIERQFSGTYLGWGEDLNTVTVWTPDVTPEPPPEEDDMPTSILYRHPNGSVALASEDGSFVVLVSSDEMEAMKYGGYQVRLGDGPSGTVALPDGLVWNLRTQIAARKAAMASTDPSVVVQGVSAILAPAVVEELGVSPDEAAEAVAAVIRSVFGQ